MLDPGLLELKGARAETKYTTLATVKFLAGLMTQRSPFASIDTRYGTRFMGGKPDALIAGSNCEISNKLTLQRRPGLIPYGVTNVAAPSAFYSWEQASPPNITLMVDSIVGGSIYQYSPTAGATYITKAAGSGQANFYDLVNTLYIGDGIDLFKIVGPNLLTQSNTFNLNPPWNPEGSTLTGGQSDPNGGTSAWQVSNLINGNGLVQTAAFNYTPIASNGFTFSVWLKQGAPGQTIQLQVLDQSGLVSSSNVNLTSSWARYQFFAVMNPGSTQVRIAIANATGSTITFFTYGAQLEVGGPATPTQITTTKPQGVYLWGIVAPLIAPTLTFAQVGTSWQAGHAYTTGNQITDSNGNLQTAQSNFTSGGTQPIWATTQNSLTNDGATVGAWLEGGPNGLSPKAGYQYYYAFLNSTTGQPSNVSPISATTGPLIGQAITVHGNGSADPQVDSIAIYRNTDGGAFFYQLATIANPGVGTWTFTDTTQDSGLNTGVFAPIGLLNSPPPTGLIGMEFHAARLWGFSGTTLFYSAAADNATLLNIIFNGVSAESWPPLNSIPFNAPIVRIVSTNAGLLVWTTQDIWIVQGSDLTTFGSPLRLFAGHGLRSYNSLDVDGSTIMMYLADRQFVTLSPSTGSMELGFPVGDQLEATFDPTQTYVARHVSGSQDNAIYLANGSTGWYRLNPNQVGASLGGEQSPLWSPFATLMGGAVKAVASVETAPGIHTLLVGQTITGPIMARSISTFSDNGAPYTWSATIGSIILATSGTLAETESITIDALAATPSVAVLLDEVSGSFETLSNSVNDPPQLVASQSLNANRYYLSQGPVPPLCRHLQIKLSGVAATTKDEVLSLTIRGALVPEQT